MSALLDRAADSMERLFPELPWKIRISRGGESRTFGSGEEKAGWECKNDEPLRALALSDPSRFLDLYVRGDVDFSGDIYATVGVRNHVADEAMWMVGMAERVKYFTLGLVPSSVKRKLIAVSSHYDLPNAFIESYLDQRTKAYSCAMWKDALDLGDDEALEDAQHHKFHMAASALEIQENDSFLDLGCGYGYMVKLAETEFGCKKTKGITLSQNQVDNGFSKNLERKHYFDLPKDKQFDKIYTCGMVSHLDKSELRRYYEHVKGMLKPGGRFWMHGIVPPANTVGMDNYNSISGTFSQRYVFPDHFQFPVHVHIEQLEKLGFLIRDVHFRYGHYAKTLRHWYQRYLEALPEVRHLINPTIERSWHLFLTFASVIDGDQGKYAGAVIKQILAVRR